MTKVANALFKNRNSYESTLRTRAVILGGKEGARLWNEADRLARGAGDLSESDDLTTGLNSYRSWQVEWSTYGRRTPRWWFQRKRTGFTLVLFGRWLDVTRCG